MSNLILGWPNRIVSGTVVAGAEVVGLDAGNLQNDQGAPEEGWQTPAGVTTTYLRLDGGYLGLWRAFGVFRTNLSLTAKLRWRIWNDSPWADGAAVYDSGMLPAGVVFGFGQSVHVAPADVAGRYVQLDVSDDDNPDNFLNIPLAYAGPAWQPKRNYSFASSSGRTSQTTKTVTRSGAAYVRNDWTARVWDLVLPAVAASEVNSRLMSLDEYARRGNNVLFLPNPASSDLQREAVFGLFEPTAQVGYTGQSGAARSWRATITERL